MEVLGFEHMHRRFNEQLDSLRFPITVSARVLSELRRGDLDVIDASTGDLWPIPRRIVAASRTLVATRSHGLEHIAHLAHLDAKARGELELSRRYPIYHGGLQLWQVGHTLRSSDAVLFLNKAERDYAVTNLRVRPTRGVIVQNGIPNELLDLPWRATPKQDSPLGIAVIGSYSWRKGAPIATDVLIETLRANPRVTASWLGTGVDASEILRSVPVDVHGRLSIVSRYENRELAGLLRDSHVLLFPSWSEGFPLSLIEAMACGLAPVASDIGGPQDLIFDEQVGLLVRAGDKGRFISAIGRLVRDRLLLDSLRHGAYNLAQSFSWTDIARNIAASYEKLHREKASLQRTRPASHTHDQKG